MPRLHNGDRFPHLAIKRVGGGCLSLPDDVAGAYAVILVYRGSWCPYCNAQLAGFARAESKLAELGIILLLFEVGIEWTVLYPTVALSYGKIVSLDYAVAVSRAYNDWLYDAYVKKYGFQTNTGCYTISPGT